MPTKPVEQGFVGMVMDVDATADDDRGLIGYGIEIAVGYQRDAVRCRNCRSVNRMGRPFV